MQILTIFISSLFNCFSIVTVRILLILLIVFAQFKLKVSKAIQMIQDATTTLLTYNHIGARIIDIGERNYDNW